VLSEVALRTPYADMHIVKGETHGMAQLGGPVISTFSCGEVYSPTLAPNSADVLVAMEVNEVLRPGFLEQVKPEGTIILNQFKVLPLGAKKEDYPSMEYIDQILKNYNVIKIDANQIAYDLGDKFGKSANVVVIGLLSTIEPFNCIPKEIWLSALISLSPNDSVKSANAKAFEKGREKLGVIPT
jgi:indolepyruvate ferredoxin oxidoreductase alpha subunit